MDFMKIIESLDEALYSVMSWLIFYPITLWRTVVRPQKMMDYADREVSDRPNEQYDDAIRPPLFLFLTLLISHGLEVATASRNPLLSDTHGLASLVDSDLALLALRLLLFSLFPLMMAVRLLHRQRTRLTHASLRRPFYGQCYTAAPFALMLGVGTLAPNLPLAGARIISAVVIGAGVLWYFATQARWFARKLRVSFFVGAGDACVATFYSIVLFVLAAIVVH
ncbi:hypothetical protein HL653_23160 [Sphingomonas sp. AP4-R1]|uniref:hypothetical protein n=1 Tax=Sphingomonas sp. AP4-R1 TaxID=2735134 RepID=UPI0014936A07|nr:hypothetical protein [Sphingomonas sp. AP4-R1]QJU60251.1 hypothetical protein HL653_23160 [Sphingomonas sp. AP4-R1]